MLAACAAALLAACGGGGGGEAPSPPGAGPQADYAPLNTGDRWVYRRGDNTLEQHAVAGTRLAQGSTAIVVATMDVASGSVDESLYVKSSSALTELLDSTDPVSVQIGDITALPLPLRQGQSLVQVDKTLAQGYDIDSDGRPDLMSIRSEVTVVGFENTTVEVGSFTQCAHLRTVLSLSATASSNGTRINVVTTIDEWYAPALGLVRQNNVTEVAGRRTTTRLELVAYAVGGSRSDARAPALVSSSPAAGAAARETLPLVLRFDKAMDGVSFRNGGFALTGPGGQVIPVSLRQNGEGTEVTAFPNSALTEGRYTVRLGAAVQDLIGNALPSQEWAFTIDKSAPLVVSALPAAGAVDVAPNATISLQFNEALNPATVNTRNISLRAGFGVETPIRVEMPDARSVLITPLQPLAAAQSYVVVLSPSVADLQGNVISNSADATYFYTVQGRLSSPARLAGAAGLGLAGGDVNGDGRTDLLTVLENTGAETPAFNVYLQNTAGGFDMPRRADVAARAGCYGVGAPKLVDMNGDGRADIVVSRGSCGIEVFYQGAAGAFDRSVLLAGGGFTFLKVADMNGDGRPDVVATAWGSDTVSVWLQRSDGSWGPERTYALFNNGYGDLAVGDLNGDGRPDIAVTSGQGDLQRALGIAYQQADGSFGTPQYRALTGTFGNSTLTMADLDGDGRIDLLTNSAGVGSLLWFRQRPDGTLAEPVNLVGSGEAWQLAVADIDGDGRRDIVIGAGGYTTYVGLLLQRADGSFGQAVTFRGIEGANGPGGMVVADLNSDGRPDVALAGPAVLSNLGSAAPQSADRTSAQHLPAAGYARRKATAAASAAAQVAAGWAR